MNTSLIRAASASGEKEGVGCLSIVWDFPTPDAIAQLSAQRSALNVQRSTLRASPLRMFSSDQLM